MNVINDAEPPLKKTRPRKLDIIPPPHFEACGLTAPLWFELILKYLFLEDLVAIKRTCKTFAKLKSLRELIKDKEWSAFQDIPKQHWNRLHPAFAYEFTNSNLKDVMFDLSYKSGTLGEVFTHYGVFSSKKLLLQAFTLIGIRMKDIHSYEISAAKVVLHWAWNPGMHDNTTIVIRGAMKEMIKLINNK